MLRRFEAIVFFFAIMLLIVLEAAVVYWIFQYPAKPSTSNPSFTAVGEWTGMVLPQAWLLGAVFFLVYRAVTVVIAPANWTSQMFSRARLAFMRLWRWSVAMIVMQELVLFLDRAIAS